MHCNSLQHFVYRINAYTVYDNTQLRVQCCGIKDVYEKLECIHGTVDTAQHMSTLTAEIDLTE